jgi:hypothetical protein
MKKSKSNNEKLKCEMIWKIWKKDKLENPVETKTIVQNFVLLLVENVVWKNISEIIRLISKEIKKIIKKIKIK